ncbi:hemerythrin domain-containing protein [Jannaschia formosa]|uniref:hemerythrin domain-containing protein n=1 Tax=Jannaschia formosa TaxID=2259592 RepID=UPI000E1BAC2E|nr:hemerythrin domain-containing protein [Jannaschia formosa]TFL16307.1 hemerythrin domain-containing protein [Jannaschia formosa]
MTDPTPGDPATDLALRLALPDALRVLAEEFPRAGWAEAQGPFRNLVLFWLDKHMSFRRLLDRLEADAQAALDGADPMAYRRSLARHGGMLINELHGHHMIEDAQYFPVMERADPVFAQGLKILDADHQALDALLHEMTDGANAVLRDNAGGPGFRDRVGGLSKILARGGPLLQRHFEDEEELVVPVLLKHEPAALAY